MLVARRRDLLNDVHGKIRSVRAESSQHNHAVLSTDDASASEIQDDIEFALIQMKAETLNKINEALDRLEEGRYGLCFECNDEGIEMAQQRARAKTRRASSALGFELGG